MTSSVYVIVFVVTLASARPLSLFHTSFADPGPQKRLQTVTGATPANTFPLIIRPSNFAPAVVAPPAIIFPSFFPGYKSSVQGAIPLFAPLRPFPYIHFLPVSTSFFVSSVRRPGLNEDHLIPTKVAAPKPSFHAIRNAQVPRRPIKKIPQRNFHPHQRIVTDNNSLIRKTHFPTEIGGNIYSNFNLRDSSDLQFSAPGGVVKSTQPSFSFVPFVNSKVSPYLLNPPPATFHLRSDSEELPTIIDF